MVPSCPQTGGVLRGSRSMAKTKQAAPDMTQTSGVTEPKPQKKQAKRPRKFTQSKFWANRYIHIMVAVTVVYFLIFRYWPLAWLSLAFKDFKILKGFWASDWVGFDNFRRIFSNMDYFWTLIRNTLAMNVLSLIFAFPAPIIFAILINEVKSKTFKRSVQTISYLPHFLSTVVVVGIFTNFLSPSLGVFNQVVRFFGGNSINVLARPRYFWALMVIIGIWQGVGWNAIIYLSAIVGIDPALYEAAKIDGAGRWKSIWHITLPGIRNTIIILLILQIGSLMSVNVEKIYLFQNDMNLSHSEMFPTYTYKLGIVRSDYSRATAIGLFSSMISLVLVMIANFLSKKYSEVSII